MPGLRVGGPMIDWAAIAGGGSQEPGGSADPDGVPEWATARSGYQGKLKPSAESESGGKESETTAAREVRLLVNDRVVATGPMVDGVTTLTVPADIGIAAGDLLTVRIADVAAQQAEVD
ncbi:hypothetical protein [Nocardia sp. NPDC050710]|uniref:hypothetical protein n=1 Tax=Nocardia sp. NPDC050710 TaxID=3157220 RepID=UPI0033D3E242